MSDIWVFHRYYYPYSYKEHTELVQNLSGLWLRCKIYLTDTKMLMLLISSGNETYNLTFWCRWGRKFSHWNLERITTMLVSSFILLVHWVFDVYALPNSNQGNFKISHRIFEICWDFCPWTKYKQSKIYLLSWRRLTMTDTILRHVLKLA